MFKVILVFLAAYFCQNEGYHMKKCQLVKELRRFKFPEDKLRDWVCLVEHESNRKTHVIGNANTDGSRDHGLFQINDRYWCSDSKTRGKCNVTCADVRKKNIKTAAACVKKIYKIHGFSAWVAWKNYCQGVLPDIRSCK